MLEREDAHLKQLLILLEQLDKLLKIAATAARVAYGADAENDPYRGIQIDQEEVERLLDREPGFPVLTLEEPAFQGFTFSAFDEDSRLVWLHQTFGLSNFDLAIIIIALAPELDRRYERLYAYLQDDVRCKRPTVDLSLNLLCASALEKLTQRTHFASEAPLIRHKLLHLISDPNQPEPTLLSHIIKLDPQVVCLLLGEQGLDRRLTPFCHLISPQMSFEDLPFSTKIRQILPTLIQADWHTSKSLKLHFHGADQSGKRHVAEAIANSLQVPLLITNLTKVLNAKVDAKATFVATLDLLLREALFQNALLYIEDLETLQTPDDEILYHSLIDCLAVYPGGAILAGTQPWLNATTNIPGMLNVSFPIPDFEQRRFYWNQHLQSANISLNLLELDTLSYRFRLTSKQIDNAVLTATNQVRWEAAIPKAPDTTSNIQKPITLTDLFTAARQLVGQDLASISRPIQPKYVWEDIVLPTTQKSLLREICNQVKHQYLVWEKWGFEGKFSLGKGLNVIFSGTSGTGKTMAAEVIARELQLDLYKIDLSQVVSKYIGETEKNLNRIFNAATNANAILLFDEADALFGKRSEVRNAHDRYANLEVSYLLQKMEEYEGLAILTTNLRSNIDDAFVRRLQFIVEFPFPTEKQRYQIWQQVFPKSVPCSPELDLDFLAHSFELTGANIRNIALTSAFLSAAENSQIEMTHIVQAVRREYQKMGKILP